MDAPINYIGAVRAFSAVFAFCGGRMRENLQEYCANYNRGDLLLQWHPEKNGAVTPKSVSPGSHTRVWWRCSQGHEWESPIYARAGKNTGCPYCTGKRVLVGADLKSAYPEIAAQWHPVKNGPLTPEQILPGSHRSAWWQCTHGHEWKALIKTRVEGNGCPICANRSVLPGVNDLQTLSPDLAKQWHPTKNGSLQPSNVVCGSSRKVWWRCDQGHEWQATIQARSAGKGCPVCSGKTVIPGINDLQSHAPGIAAQWDPEKNGTLKPDQVALHSNRQAWWRCEKEHSWKTTVYSRTFNRSGCPYCTGRKVLAGFNDLKTREPRVAAQWHPTKNETLKPTMVTPGCRKRVWWKCSLGHEWKAVIYSRTGNQMCGCPVCAGRTVRQT